MALRISPHYQEYHVIALKTEKSFVCIVTNDEAYDGMCWLETADTDTLKAYTRWKPITLMELAEKLRIKKGMPD